MPFRSTPRSIFVRHQHTRGRRLFYEDVKLSTAVGEKWHELFHFFFIDRPIFFMICSALFTWRSFRARTRTVHGSLTFGPNRASSSVFPLVGLGFRGVDDLRDGIIRTPLSPMITFQDDPLRVLRAVRFAARFGFTLHEASPGYVCYPSKRTVRLRRWSCRLW